MIKKNWKDAGGKPNRKDFVVVIINNKKLVRYSSGYVRLCNDGNCRNLTSSTGKCSTHNKGKETYEYCRFFNCPMTPSFGYERNKA